MDVLRCNNWNTFKLTKVSVPFSKTEIWIKSNNYVKVTFKQKVTIKLNFIFMSN